MKKYDFKNIKNWAINNKFLLILFIVSTIFFLLQYFLSHSWDFSAYTLNAKYLFQKGNYYEVYRAPLISLILGPLLYLGNLAAYIYILLISSLFFISTIKLSDALYEKVFNEYKIKKETLRLIFYFFLLSPFLLIFGLIEGTELLGLTFLQLFLAYYIKNKPSGHFLGLAFLSRYNFLLFFPLLFFNKDYKKILKNIALFLIVTIPWFIFNYFKWGNPFTSFIDSYYLNVYARLGMIESFNVFSLLYPIEIALPFFLFGLFLLFKQIKNKKFKEYKYSLLFLIVFLIFVYEIISIPFKVTRYMFNMAVPIAFFSVWGLLEIMKFFNKKYGKEKTKKVLTIILLVLFSIFVLTLLIISIKLNANTKIYKEIADKVTELNIENCQLYSPHWVPIAYYLKNPIHPPQETLDKIVDKFGVMIILKGSPTMDDLFKMEDLSNYPSIYESERIIFIANENLTKDNCLATKPFDSSRLEEPCYILSTKFEKVKLNKIAENVCNLMSKK